ncbi:MAG: sugar phosphate isomerase/epimerase family protein [Pseudomonadota bacterium]
MNMDRMAGAGANEAARAPSVSTAVLDGHPIDVGLDLLAAADVTAIEPAYIAGYVDFDEDVFCAKEAHSWSERASARGMRLSAVSAHTDLGAVDAIAYGARRIRFAAELGVPIWVTNAAATQNADAFFRAMERLVELAEEAGIVIALENPGHGDDALVHDAKSGRDAVARIGSDHVRLNYDVGNALTYSKGAARPEADIVAALPACASLHLKDVRDDPSGWTFTALGEGEIDWNHTLARTLTERPDLSLGIELPLRLARPGRADPVRRTDPVPLDRIRSAVETSLKTVEAARQNVSPASA